MDINLGLSALATGTVDVITATYSPAPTLVDKKILFLRAIGANGTTTPTFNPNGLGAKVITKKGGDALAVGDITGAGFVALLMYESANNRWVLLNPQASVPVSTLAQVLDAGNQANQDIDMNVNSIQNASFVGTGNSVIDLGGGLYLGITTDAGGYATPYLFLDPINGLGQLGDVNFEYHFGSGTPSAPNYISQRTANTSIVHDTEIELNAPSVKINGDEVATVPYVDGLVAGLLDDRGSYDASVNTFPATGGSGTAGAILKGDIWYISVAGTLGGVAVTIGDSVRAIADTPGQTATNWSVLETNIGYVPENVSNKATDFAVVNDTKYPTIQAVVNYIVAFANAVVTLTNKTISLASNTLTGTKAQFDTACSDGNFIYDDDTRLTDSRNRKIFAQENTTQSHTGDNTETIKINLPIPASSIGANGVFRFESQINKTGAVGTGSYRAYLSPNNNSLTGATQIGMVALGVSVSSEFERRVANKNSESLNEVFNPTTNAATDRITSAAAISALNIDTSVNLWFIMTYQNTVTTETGRFLNTQIYIDKP